MCKGMQFLKNNIQIIVTVLSIISMALFWIFTMNGIPAELERVRGEMKLKIENVNKRVDSIDDRLRLTEISLEKNTARTEMTLEAVYEIRGLLLRR